jgi:hypothetical protein
VVVLEKVMQVVMGLQKTMKNKCGTDAGQTSIFSRLTGTIKKDFNVNT